MSGEEVRSESARAHRMARMGILFGLVGALVGSGGTLLGALITNDATQAQAKREFQQEQRMTAYTDLVSAIDQDQASRTNRLAGIYWRLTPGHEHDPSSSDDWESDMLGLSHSVTRVLLVGTADECSLAEQAYDVSLAVRKRYTQAATSAQVLEMQHRADKQTADIRHRFITQAIKEMQE